MGPIKLSNAAASAIASLNRIPRKKVGEVRKYEFQKIREISEADH